MAIVLPEIMLLSLSYQEFPNESITALFDKILKVAYLKRVKTVPGALQYLEVSKPAAIIVTDEGIANKENSIVLERVKAYIESGGTVIVGLHFPHFIKRDAFNYFFQDVFGLPWCAENFHRDNCYINPSCTLPSTVEAKRMPERYFCIIKVLNISGARNHEKLFIPIQMCVTYPMVFTQEWLDQTEAGIVGAKIGAGYLAFVGDVNVEDETSQIIMVLCGLEVPVEDRQPAAQGVGRRE